jgi:hypothetical protein
MTRTPVVVGVLIVSLFCGATVANDAWIHVRVDSERDGTVRVNVPMSFAEAILPSLDVEGLVDGKIRIEGIDLEELDLADLLEQLARVEDAELVTVRDGEQTVTMSKQGRLLLVDVDENRGATEVRVRLPLDAVGALVGDRRDLSELDLVAAMRVLTEYEGDLVHVRDGEESVRVWIDRRSSMTDAEADR